MQNIKQLKIYLELGKVIVPMITNGKNYPIGTQHPKYKTLGNYLDKEKGQKWFIDNWSDWQGNWSWRLTEEDLIVDIDVKNQSLGLTSLKLLENEIGVKLEPTVRTPSGGYHVYFKKPHELKINRSIKKYPGIEFCTIGYCQMIPPSKINKNQYQFIKDSVSAADFLIEAPLKLLNIIQSEKNIVLKKTKPEEDHNLIDIEQEKATRKEPQVAEVMKVLGEKFSNDPNYLSEYHNWLDLGMRLHHWDSSGEEGFSIWLKFSEENINFESKEELQRKWESFTLNKTNLKTLAALIHTFASITTSKDFAICRIGNNRNFCSLQKRERINSTIFNMMACYTVPYVQNDKTGKKTRQRPNIYYQMMPHKIKMIKDVCYFPQGKEPLHMHDGELYCNTFQNAKLPAVPEKASDKSKENIKIFEDHIIKLICSGNREYGLILIQYFAFLIQHKGTKLPWAPIIQSVEGMGKTEIARLLRRMLGFQNVKEASPEAVFADYNTYACDCLLCVVEELKLSGKRRDAVANKLKPFLTNENVIVRRMYAEHVEMPNYTNYLIFTNHKACIPINNNSRRYFVIHVEVQSLEEASKMLKSDMGEYFRKFRNMVTNHSADILKYLDDYPISEGFYNLSTAPYTTYKEESQELELTNIEGYYDIEKVLSGMGEQDIISLSILIPIRFLFC